MEYFRQSQYCMAGLNRSHYQRQRNHRTAATARGPRKRKKVASDKRPNGVVSIRKIESAGERVDGG